MIRRLYYSLVDRTVSWRFKFANALFGDVLRMNLKLASSYVTRAIIHIDDDPLLSKYMLERAAQSIESLWSYPR